MRDRALFIAVVLAAGCVEPASVSCGDGTVCPAEHVCHDGGRCVRPDQLKACSGLGENVECDLGAAGRGVCRLGVCEVIDCGDGVVGVDEACDDGNRTSGDGCPADCAKIEMCGDMIVDTGEGCDDANDNAVDGCDRCTATMWTATPLIGGNLEALGADLLQPYGVAFDGAGNLFIADRFDHRVQRIQAGTGLITVIAGTGVPGRSGDGGAATSAQIHEPCGVAVDGLGNLYIADRQNHRIRKVDATTGVITTVAGTFVGPGGDDGPAVLAQLSEPTGVAVDGLGNLYIADTGNSRIRRVDQATGIITKYAGTFIGFAGDGGDAADAQLNNPRGVALSPTGDLYIADSLNHRIRRIDAVTTRISTVVGTGVAGYAGEDSPAISANLNSPDAITFDTEGDLYIADRLNDRIRRVKAGLISTVAGSGVEGFSGDNGPAMSARLWEPNGVAFDGAGAMYIADKNNRRIRRVAANTMTTIAGRDATSLPGDGRAALSSSILGPGGLALDAAGHLFVADGAGHNVRRVDAVTGDITTIAGTGTASYSGDGGPAAGAGLNRPGALAFDAAGNLYIADTFNQRVRRVDVSTGEITTFVGTGVPGFGVDNVPAKNARLFDPQGLAFTAAGELLIADSGNHRIRKVAAAEPYLISTVAGIGVAAFTDGPVASAALSIPVDVAVDVQGTMWIADSGNHRIRKVVAGVVSTVAGTGTASFSGDNGLATAAALQAPSGIAVDPAGHLYIADNINERIRRVDATTRIITTIAGATPSGASGDGGLAAAGRFSRPHDVVRDAAGNLLISDRGNGRIRRIAATTNVITSIAGAVDPDGMGPIALARLSDARALVVAAPYTLIAGGSSGVLQAVHAGSGRLEVVAGRYKHGVETGNLARFRSSSFGAVMGVAHDETSGQIYMTNATAGRVHAVTPVVPADENTWTMRTLAGNAPGFADGALGMALFRDPSGMYFDAPTRTLYVADTGNHVIRAIDVGASTVTTIAGRPLTLGFGGDTGPATMALLYRPQAITRCPNGDVFIADTGNHRVRRVEAMTGVISTVIGDGGATSSGQGAPSSGFPVNSPLGLACDPAGNLFVSSATTIRLLIANAAGVVDGNGPVQTIFGAPPRDTFPASVTFCLSGVAVVDASTVQVTDACSGMLIELKRQAL